MDLFLQKLGSKTKEEKFQKLSEPSFVINKIVIKC